jgi:hypothetical protein
MDAHSRWRIQMCKSGVFEGERRVLWSRHSTEDLAARAARKYARRLERSGLGVAGERGGSRSYAATA